MVFIQRNTVISFSILVFSIFSDIVPGISANIEFPPVNIILPNCNSYRYMNPVMACTREYFPLCGSDGKTYSNICVFCMAVRCSGGRLAFSHYSPC